MVADFISALPPLILVLPHSDMALRRQFSGLNLMYLL